MENSEAQYDIAFSFAGEDREYVKKVASALKEKGIKIFYDEFEAVSLWGKNLYQYLSEIYSKKARFVVIFISEAYSKKLWTSHELQAAQARAFNENYEYILPARFDNTEIPGIHSTVGYINLSEYKPDEFSELIIQKLIKQGCSIPSDILRRDYFYNKLLPNKNHNNIEISIKCHASTIPECSVALISKNGIIYSSKTDINGIAHFSLPIRKEYDILVSHPSFPGAIIKNFDSINSIEIELFPKENVGSQIIHSTGYIPKIYGRLNPILDDLKRTYLYAENISINNGAIHPVFFEINHPLELEDKSGNICHIVFKYINHNTFFVQYRFAS